MADEFDQSSNPYASPRIPYEPAFSEMVGEGVFRFGTLLVVYRDARLPNFCVMTNEPADTYIKMRFMSGMESFKFEIFPQEMTLEIGLTNRFLQGYRLKQMMAAFITLLGMFMMCMGIANELPRSLNGYIFAAGLVSLVISPIYAMIACRLVEATEVTSTHACLKGAHPDYLARLPEWPGG